MLRKLAVLLLFLTGPLFGQNSLEIRGEDALEISSYSTVPGTADNTHFGNVAEGSNRTIEFTVVNTYSGFLSFLGLDLGTISVTGSDASEFTVSDPVQSYLAFGQQTTFTVTLNSSGTGIKDAEIVLTPRILGVIEIESTRFFVRGLTDTPVFSLFNSAGVRIENNDLPLNTAFTDFEEIILGDSASRRFRIVNEGTENLQLSVVQSDDQASVNGEWMPSMEFSQPVALEPDDEVYFEVTYSPVDSGEDILQLSFESNDSEADPFLVNFIGAGRANPGAELMISQYYENRNSDYIEVKNMSENLIPGQSYYLAQYRKNRRLDRRPSAFIELGSFQPGEVKVYDNFSLRGNEIMVISTSRGRNSYEDRSDIIGNQQFDWGVSKSMTKGGCASETAHLDFDPSHWIDLSLAKVDDASSRQNIALGTYNPGPISWSGNSWTDNGLPDLSRIVHLNANYQSNLGTVEACDLIVNEQVSFNNGTKNSLVVYRDIEINAGLMIGDQESLVMYDDQARITGEIKKVERSTYRNNTHDFTYWSAPIENGQLSQVFSGVNPNRIYYYDQSQTSTSDSSHPDYWKTWVLASGNMVTGMGYAAEGISGEIGVHQIEFTGKPNNGVIFVPLNFWNDTDMDNDFNMIGNPYPSAIDIEMFFDENEGLIDPTIYLWTHTTPVSGEDSGDFSPDDYATYNYTGGTGIGSGIGDGPIPEKNIGSSQGFFVRAISSGNLRFDNSMRMEDANDQFFKPSQKAKNSTVSDRDRLWLNLKTDQGGFNQILIGFLPNASSGLDLGFDAVRFKSYNKISFYSVVEDRKLAIQAESEFHGEHALQLGFDSTLENRTYTIEIERSEGLLKKVDIFLYDRLLQVEHELSSAPYTFKQKEAGEFPNRFELLFRASSTLSVEDVEMAEDIKVTGSENSLIVESQELIESLKVYDVLGRLIYKSDPQSTRFEVRETNGIGGRILLMEFRVSGNKTRYKKVFKQAG